MFVVGNVALHKQYSSLYEIRIDVLFFRVTGYGFILFHFCFFLFFKENENKKHEKNKKCQNQMHNWRYELWNSFWALIEQHYHVW